VYPIVLTSLISTRHSELIVALASKNSTNKVHCPSRC